jgi:hypothetical protein
MMEEKDKDITAAALSAFSATLPGVVSQMYLDLVL